jgi:hypothetical protein
MALVFKAMVVQTAASMLKVTLTDEEQKTLCEFGEGEKMALSTCAPYAAEYSGQMSEYAKPIFAIGFVGIFGFSTYQSLRIIKSKAPPRPRNVMKRKPQPPPKSRGLTPE